MTYITWVEISREALSSNAKILRKLVGDEKILCPCVKSNAYGHGIVESSKIFLDSGADWLAVNSLSEAKTLRDSGIDSPIYVMGYVPLDLLEDACEMDLRLVVYNRETILKLGKISEKSEKPLNVHIKVETGNNRQGVLMTDLIAFAKHIRQFENIQIEGLSTHFANIEDTGDRDYADLQLGRFNEAIRILKGEGISIPLKHCANSAATLLFPETHFNMVRTGIASYGMWPSKKNHLSFIKKNGDDLGLRPAFTWKTKIVQIKNVPAGDFIGYGCTYKTTQPTRLAVLPVGYYDGYDRGIRGAHVLIHDKIAPVLGRICMNIMMVDITNIPESKLEDEVILIGRDKTKEISAEQMAEWIGTINYEVTTRVNENIPRIVF